MMEDTDAPETASREALVPDCQDTTEGVICYSDASYTVIVGYVGCGCEGRWSRWGDTSTLYFVPTDACFEEP
ncbi:hypothetical protein LXT21_15415 [Myxococcus sp. K38C18041901]|uniref:hypothetical protein n=1 Tax=Myxococcus guangdongensis TaxID=2906760 RepID=UPI0020A7D9A9|nr:hypothetical protein [Myxococcus guangdongensis]MCP3060172.1 hypothetical protein [Myxococcus guangdongensis]